MDKDIKKTEQKLEIIPTERIVNKIFFIREKKVMLDNDLADLYSVSTKVLNQAIKRNPKRFPEDFMFQLTKEEMKNLRSQIVTSNWGGSEILSLCFYGTRRGNAFQCLKQRASNTS